jgi:hypothetical protein
MLRTVIPLAAASCSIVISSATSGAAGVEPFAALNCDKFASIA